MNAWRTYETPGSKRKDCVTSSTSGGISISKFVADSFASQFHKDKEERLGWTTSHIMGCVIGKES